LAGNSREAGYTPAHRTMKGNLSSAPREPSWRVSSSDG